MPTDPRFHLYRMDGPALDRLSPPVAIQQTRTGFVYRDRLVWGELQDVIHVRDASADYEIELPGAYIYRVAYRADVPKTLLITGHWIKEGEVFTLEYDLATGRQFSIECDGQPGYKCTILGEHVLYAERTGAHFEERKIRRSANTVRRAVRIATEQFRLIFLKNRC